MGALHVAAAAVVLVLGAAMLLLPKGTRWHVLMGRVYVAAMLLLLGAALATYAQTGRFGGFHVMALVSLTTLGAGLWPIWVGRRTREGIDRHRWFMTWTYVGVVAAGLAQVANGLLPEASPWPVLVSTLVVTAIGGALTWASFGRTAPARQAGTGCCSR